MRIKKLIRKNKNLGGSFGELEFQDKSLTQNLSIEKPLIHQECSIKNSNFGRFVEIGMGTHLLNAFVGDYSYCARYCDFANVEIGKFSNIASFVRIGPTDHPMDKASLHHFLYRSNDYWKDQKEDHEFFAAREARMANVGHDTWLGHGSIIKPEVIIGHGSIIGAGSVVTKNIKPYSIVAGNPARLIRMRFKDKVVDQLMEMSWWDWDHDTIGQRLKDFRELSVESFIEKFS